MSTRNLGVPRALRWIGRVTWSGVLAGGAGGVGVILGAAPAGAASCTVAGSTGLTAAVVQTANMSGKTVDATGCDVGIYVPPGTSGITITGVTVSGAHDHGIFVQDASGITISGSTLKGNGVAPTPGIPDDKALELVGTSDSTITGNTVTGNLASGGIGVYDDGRVDNGAPRPGTSSPANGDTVSNNTVSGNFGGCAIVVSSVSANVPAAGASNDVVSNNTLTDPPGQFGPHGPVVGGIIVAGRSMSNITVTGNTITGAAQPGVIVHANAPGSTVSGVKVTNNIMSNDDWLGINGPPAPAAIVVAVTPIPPPATPVITGTTITGNTISAEHYGIWLAGATGSVTSPDAITTTPGGAALFSVPRAGSGYWLAGAGGGAFSLGAAGFYGSAGGGQGTVGMAPSLDQGGYWLAGSDGSVKAFGDAAPYGSMAGKPPAHPVVGIAATPVAPAPPGEPGMPAGKGYWLVTSAGGVFSFGDAGFYGSTGLRPPAHPVVGMAATPDGHGYWLVTSAGDVFNFGDAGFYGSTGLRPPAHPVVGMAATPDGHGYWLVTSAGGVFSFGDAGFHGSLAGQPLARPVVGMAAIGVTATA